MILSVLLIFASNISANRKSIDVIRINDPITPVISEYVISSINAAEKKSAECIVIEMDTPGGLDLAMRDIVKK